MKKFPKIDADLFKKIEKTKLKKIVGGTDTESLIYNLRTRRSRIEYDGDDRL